MFPDLSEKAFIKAHKHLERSYRAKRAAETRRRRYRTRFEDSDAGRRWEEALARVRSRGPF